MTAYVRRASVAPHLVDDRDPPAIALLKEDHQILRVLFDLIETTDDDVLFPVAGDICIRLAIHLAVEEHLFYPALNRVLDTSEIDERIVEHQVTKSLISEIMDLTGRERFFRAKVHVLGEESVHHFDEEDRLLFPQARKAFEDGRIDLVELGTEMGRHRRDLFNLVGSTDTRIIDLKLATETAKGVWQSRKRNGVAARLQIRESA